jgi:hypothetical protein
VSRIIPLLAIVVLAAACQTQAQPAPTPIPSPSPHTAPTAAVLQPANVPAGLTACASNGAIDAYLTSLTAANPSVATAASTAWAGLRAGGATSGAISIYSADPSACTADLGAASNIKSVTSFVAEFAEPGEADRAWEAGVFGFAPPAAGEVVPGVTRGIATGLGLSSFTYVRTPVLLASWHRSVFVALIVTNLVDLTAFNAATAAVDARLN